MAFRIGDIVTLINEPELPAQRIIGEPNPNYYRCEWVEGHRPTGTGYIHNCYWYSDDIVFQHSRSFIPDMEGVVL